MDDAGKPKSKKPNSKKTGKKHHAKEYRGPDLSRAPNTPPIAAGPVEGSTSPTIRQDAKAWVASVTRKAAHDAAADLLKRVIVGIVVALVLGGGITAAIRIQLNEKLKDQRDLAQRVDKLEKDALSRNQPAPGTSSSETGALSVEEQKRRQAEADCVTARTKDVESLTYQRKVAYGDITKCIADWKPRWFSTETAEQACSPKRETYNHFYRLVKQKETKDCNLASRQP